VSDIFIACIDNLQGFAEATVAYSRCLCIDEESNRFSTGALGTRQGPYIKDLGGKSL
jgi:hypothetical protein